MFFSLDPRFVIGTFALIVFSAFIIRSTWGLLLVFFYVLALVRLAGLSSPALARAARIVGPFVLLIVAINAFLVEGEPIVGSFRFITREGVTSGIHAGVRVLVLYFSMIVFLAVVSAEDVARSVCALIDPVSPTLADRIAMHAYLAFGFLPLFADELRRIEVAQRFRGGGLDGGFSKKLEGARLLVVPLVLSAIHRSGELAMTVELRRIPSRIEGILVLEEASWRDYVLLVATAAVLAAAYLAF